jgi:hypothetical protein
MVKDIAEEAPLTALRLLQVCGVNKFGHVISGVPPAIIHLFTEARDAAVVHCMEAVHEYKVYRTIIQCTSGGSGRRVATLLSATRRRKPPRHLLPHCMPSHSTLPHCVRSYSTEVNGAPFEPVGASGWWRVSDTPP